MTLPALAPSAEVRARCPFAVLALAYLLAHRRPARVAMFLPPLDVSPAPDTSDAPVGPVGTETVLIVDDERALRTAIRRMLERAGYEVLEAVDGREALAACSTHADRIALVISDVVMPQMGGRAFLAQLRAGFPRARAILMSGYREACVTARDETDGVPRLDKPFTACELLQLVRETLDAPLGGRCAS